MRNKRVVCMSVEKWGWKNVHLMKDCGLVPYYFYKLYGYEAIMVTPVMDEYIYQDTYVKGLKIDFIDEDTTSARVNYVKENAANIDLLILHGPYHPNLSYAKVYRSINPNGKIYLQLDMNSQYGEWLFGAHPELLEFTDICDVIATSCTWMQNAMNKRLPCAVECITNGYYDGFFKDGIPDFDTKEKIITTVSRLGTWQKNTEVLLEAYAKAYADIAEWKLVLIGSIDEAFKNYISEYYEKYPMLKDKVTFTGVIKDKEVLLDYYKRTTIFAMPSRIEGGAPNVVSEALRSGCVMAVTRFDAYEDITDDNKCGRSCEIEDVDGFAEILRELCNRDDLIEMGLAAYHNALKRYDYNKIIPFLHRLIYGGQVE